MTYQEAKKAATKKNAGIVYSVEQPNGERSEVYWCEWRKRQVWTYINKAGYRVV
jgi:hypothetical protein